MKPIDVFLQSLGHPGIAVLSAEPGDTIGVLLSKAGEPARATGELLVFQEDLPGELDREVLVEELLPLAADEDSVPPLRLHLSSCRKVQVVVRFNGEEATRTFPPGTTVERVRRWAARRAFELSPRDAAEHVLQLQGGADRPDRDTHIGTLTGAGICTVAFDLVPSQRVEG